MVPTSSSALNEFNEQGYMVIPNVLDPEEDLQPVFNEYSEVLDRVIEHHSNGGDALIDLPFLDRMAKFIAATGGTYYKHFEIRLPYEIVDEDTPIHLGAEIFALLRNPRLLDGIETFIGPEISCNPVNVIRLKPPESLLPAGIEHAGIASTPWHQDLVNYPEEAENTDFLTVWVALTDASEDMGCLSVIPGSHRIGLETHCPGKINYSSPLVRRAAGGGIPEELVDSKRALPVPMKAGDVLFMHKLTMHAARPNVSNRLRWSFDLRYHPSHQYSGQPLKPSWIARSMAHPENEVTDHQVWQKMWMDTKSFLMETREIPAYLRYDFDNPICAPRWDEDMPDKLEANPIRPERNEMP